MGSGLTRDQNNTGNQRCHKAGSNHRPSEVRAQAGKHVGRESRGGVETGLHHRSFRGLSFCL